MPPPRPEAVAAFDAMVPFAAVGRNLCEMAGLGDFRSGMSPQVICTVLGIPQSRAADVEMALEAGRGAGLFTRVSETTWRAADESLGAKIAPLLEGAYLYRSRAHRDVDMVDVVLTKPQRPSAMAEALDRSLEGTWGLQDTQELLPAIAESAEESFTILTPFLDEMGAGIVVNLFERAAVRERFLILRTEANGAAPVGLVPINEKLRSLGVAVLNFRLARLDGQGFETFHAKAVLADRVSAYLGSTNMLKSSFKHSLEMGLYVRGRAAGRIADILLAIRSVSVPM